MTEVFKASLAHPASPKHSVIPRKVRQVDARLWSNFEYNCHVTPSHVFLIRLGGVTAHEAGTRSSRKMEEEETQPWQQPPFVCLFFLKVRKEERLFFLKGPHEPPRRRHLHHVCSRLCGAPSSLIGCLAVTSCLRQDATKTAQI